MKRISTFWLAVIIFLHAVDVDAHIIGDEAHDHPPAKYDRGVKPPVVIKFAQAQTSTGTAKGKESKNVAPPPAAIFAPFAPKVTTRWDDQFFYVESDAMPDHRMMVGITAWQQQVPIPQNYFGDNAWRFPLQPVVAANPLSAKSHFFRGAIALAANGVPIFNPIKNDGHTDTFLAGELDEFGGHAGRGDDYHYHTAPVHLQKAVGVDKPVAYALDGYAIYGFAEPDGTPAGKLDSFNGHTTSALGYHYHATKTYPYLNGGFHGEVVERDGQVDPQPRAQGVREALPPLRGARITGFTSPKTNSYSLQYQVGGETRYVNYILNSDKTARFDFVDGKGAVRTENYSSRQRSGGDEKGGANKNKREPEPRNANEPARDTSARQPWMKVHGKEMDANGDGTLTQAELIAEVEKVFVGYDKNKDGKLIRDEYEGAGGVRSAMGGFVKQHAQEIDVDGNGIITKDELTATATRMFDRTDVNRDGKLAGDELVLPPGYKATPPDGNEPRPKRKESSP